MSTKGKVQSLLDDGKSKEEIYSKLLSEGLTVSEIQESFANIDELVHDSDEDHSQKGTINTILTIAAILVGVGVFSFIASNWDQMSKLVKVFIIISSMLVSYWFGYYFYVIKELKRIGEALFLLANFIFGAGIFLIGQIFNIRANWPDGFILWMIGVLAVSKATDLLNLYQLAVALGVISLVIYPMYSSLQFWNGGHSFLFTSSLLLFLASGVCFYLGYEFLKDRKLEN